ncbi:MAG: hypothetical protein OSA98_23020 [Rubripirellula sp.]|nr:hypothetical protein [Rubripirellula sp.]
MTKHDFYRNKQVRETEWWLHSCDLPVQKWARLRVFNDGTADSCFGPNDTLFGFDNRDYAGYILSEDEYIRLNDMDREDEDEYGIVLMNIVPPTWPETDHQ